jgi:adenosyl cobinamide kinase/adenosyl cobinamide phosphate guanylyltransferase
LEKNSEKEIKINNVECCYEYKDILIFLYRKEGLLNRIEYLRDNDEETEGDDDKDFAIYKCKILYQNAENLETVKACIDRDTDQKKHSNVYLLCSMDGMLALQRFDIKLPQKTIDLEMNYGSEAAEKFEKVMEHLSKNKNGLILFSGDPGTGKSTFIKYITTKTTRKVIYLSSGAAEQLTNPDFLSFIMGHRNSILLLEDAEKVLRSRDSQDNEAISNILNITDGILGDCLNIMVIATFNIDREKIDSALVRKGRLFLDHHFKALSADDANKLLEKIGSKRTTQTPLTLAEIYNEEDNGFVKEEKKKVGF